MTGSPLAPRGDGAAELPVGDPKPSPWRLVYGAVAFVVGFAVVGFAIHVWTGDDSANRTLGHEQVAVPSVFGSHVRLNDAAALRTVEGIRSQMSSANQASKAVFGDGVIGVFAPRGTKQPDLFVLANDVRNDSVAKVLRGLPSDAAVSKNLTKGAGIAEAPEFPTGAPGGSVRCGLTSTGTEAFDVCVWADTSSIGLVLAVSTSPATLAGLTGQVRAAAES